ncbi:MAG TPA: SRPBCC family protein [Gaiellaceae bacterium]|nr:SRPBCC family protein [Gaiellaceae bacterium]
MDWSSLPQYAARRTLPAPVETVWEVLAQPARWTEWWPDLELAEPTVRRALAPGALWQIEGAGRPAMFRRPLSGGALLILEVVPLRRVAFQLPSDRIEVELELEPVTGDGETVATLAVDVPRFGGVRRTMASDALAKLAAAVRPPAD